MKPLASLREQLYVPLRNEIQQGNMEPGSVTHIGKLSQELGINRTPLKEAIIKLESEKFVAFLPPRRMRVRELTQQELKEFHEVIGCLESGVVCAGFHRLRSSDCIKRMEQSNAERIRALERREFDRYYHLDLEFHGIFPMQAKSRNQSRARSWRSASLQVGGLRQASTCLLPPSSSSSEDVEG